MFTTRRLPACLPPLSDEAFSSWLIRLAAAHSLKTRSLCSLLSGEPMEFNRDLDGVGGEKLHAVVAARTWIDPEHLRASHTLMGFEGRLFDRMKPNTMTTWVLPQGSYKIRRPAMQFCSACLAEGPAYFRRSWRLSVCSVCVDHGVNLHHVCPACSAVIDPIRSDMRHRQGTSPFCWQCAFDLRESATCVADPQDVLLAREHACALRTGSIPVSAPLRLTSSEYFSALALLCARLLQRKPRLACWQEKAAEQAGVILPQPFARHASTAFDTLATPATRRAVLRTASWLLQEWPERFILQAKASGTRTSDFVPNFAVCPLWFLEPLQKHLTPPRHKPVPTPGLERARRMREMILARRHDWVPSRLPRLIRALREAGFYAAETDDCIIMRSLPSTIAKLRLAHRDHRRIQTQQIPRGTPQWSLLLLQAKSYRKTFCSSPEKLKRGILLLCADQFLSGRDLSELLRRSQSVLVCRYLIPMVKRGELEAKFSINQGGLCRAHPRQAYRRALVNSGR